MSPVEVIAAQPDHSTGVMVCVRPDAPERFVVDGGTPLEEIHLTLLYLGTTETFDDSAAEQAREVLSSEIAPEFKGLVGEISGLTTFRTEDGEAAPLVLLVDVPGLAELYVKSLHSLRAALGSEAQPYCNHGFTPHITLGYGVGEELMGFAQSLVGLKVKFDELELVVGTETSNWPLGRESMSIAVHAGQSGLLLDVETPSWRPGAAFTHAQEGQGMSDLTTEERLTAIETFLVAPDLPSTGDTPMVPDHSLPADDPMQSTLCPGSGGEPASTEAGAVCLICGMPVDDMGDPGDERPMPMAPMAVEESFEATTSDAATFAATPVHHTATTDSTDFDGDEVKTRTRSGETPGYYNSIYAWYDPTNKPDNKTAYKFPHHMVSETGAPGAAVNWAVHAALLLIDESVIPEQDYVGVYNHLAAHLKDAGLEVPDLGADNASVEDVRSAIFTISQMSLAPTPIPMEEEEMPTFDVTQMDDTALVGEFMRRYQSPSPRRTRPKRAERATSSPPRRA